jgi:hypothetical protein
MNRRNFIKTVGVGIGGLTSLPTLSVEKSIPLYKEFDWLSTPSGLLYRIENHNGKKFINDIPFCVKTQRIKLVSDVNVDYTKEIIVDGKGSYDIFKAKEERLQIYYTNEFLLRCAKEQGYTHLYEFCRVVFYDVVTLESHSAYFVRGVKLPDWKTVDGKLQVVNV